MKTVEQIMDRAEYYAECIIGTHLRPTIEKEYHDLDAAAKELRTAIEELAADAVLMAAAPELLEALINLERTAGLPAMHDDPVRVTARAAIAKATGEQE